MNKTLAFIVALSLAAPCLAQDSVGIIIGPVDTNGNLRDIAGLADPNASRVLKWNDSTNVIEWGVDSTGGGGGSGDVDSFAADPTDNANFSPSVWRSELGLTLDSDVQRYDVDLTSLAGGIVGVVKGQDDDGGYTAASLGTDYINNSSIDTSAEIAAIVAGETGTGNLVFSTSPTLATPVIASIVNSGTLTLPTSTDTLVGRATTDTLTNKTLTAPTLNGTPTLGSASSWRTALSLRPGTDVQGYDIDLTSIAGGVVGLVKGNDDGGGFSAAVSGTDYVAPDTDLADLADGTLTGSKVSGAVTVSGGTINNSVIGGTTPAAATFTNATVNGVLKLYDSVAAAYVDVTVEDSAVSYENIGGVLPMIVADEAYDATGWNGDLTVPTKNAVRDKIEALGGGFASSDIDTSAELRAIVTDETGSGALVFGTSPTIGTPAISGGTINNATVGATTPASGAFTSLICNDSFYVKDTGASVSGRIDYTNSGGWSILDSALSAADLTVKNTAYNATSWNGVSKVPTMDAVRDLAVTLQASDADLDDLADGSLTGSKVSSATTSAVGVSELATSAETTTGSDTTRTITPDAYRGSDFGKRFGQFVCVGSATTLTTGDGKGEVFYRVPSELNGWNLVGVAAAVDTVSSSGTPTFQVRRRRLTSATATSDADMLSTAITIDASEFDSKDATTAAVINTSNDDVNTGDRIFADCDTAGTGTKGMSITLVFQKP